MATVLAYPNRGRDEMRRVVEAKVAQEREQIEGVEKANPQFRFSEVIQALRDNEIGDARLFVRLFKGKFCFDHAEQQWYQWAGNFWRRDNIKAVIAAVEGVVNLYEKAAARQAENKRKAAKARSSYKKSNTQETKLLKRIRDLQTWHRRQQVLKLACAGENS